MKTLKQNWGIYTLIQYDITKYCLLHVHPSPTTLINGVTGAHPGLQAHHTSVQSADIQPGW